MDEKISVLPVAPLRDGPVFPYTDVPLIFGRSESVAALKNAADANRLVFVVFQKTPGDNESNVGNLRKIGTICQIKYIFQGERDLNVLVTGVARGEAISYENNDSHIIAQVREIPDKFDPQDPEITALVGHITTEFQNAIRMGHAFDLGFLLKITSGMGPAEMTNQMAMILDLTPDERQGLLEETDVKNRLKKIADQLSKETKMIEIERKLMSQSQAKFDKSVRENFLREKKRAIEEELGQPSEETNEITEMRTKAKKAGMPEDVLKKTLKEIKRLEQMNAMNPESGYIKTYVEWLLDMPWKSLNASETNITDAEKILNEDHYGLEKVKERIVEYLAIMKLKEKAATGVTDDGAPSSDDEEQEKAKSGTLPQPSDTKKIRKNAPTIICFVGPPGVGKTSIGKSIARALGRKFVRVSLGGIRDEAEIRGHRRTYVGAMPGRILQGIKQAGAKNPVYMLDEIDKLGQDFRGDPSSALLEVLDPEQNFAFSDHYLEVPYDLSEVIFIATANVLENIPGPLLDRLEVIEFPGYTLEEKYHIAEKYLIPKQLETNGLKTEQVAFSAAALKLIISRYTYEAGVRNLEREIATVLRKIAKTIAEGHAQIKITVRPVDLHKYLGPFKTSSTIAEREDEAGLSTGLFVTMTGGGGILLIETAIMPGKGQLVLTGKLGEVMQESAKAAHSYVRSRWQKLGLPENLFNKIDIHIHFPEGAIPKDGPSAGIAITTSLVSALTKLPVKHLVGMTGEVTLRGRVLPIGGLKEKVIGASLAGIKTIVAPKENKKDLEDIPKNVTKGLEFKFVDNMDEVLDIALIAKPQTKSTSAAGKIGRHVFLHLPEVRS